MERYNPWWKKETSFKYNEWLGSEINWVPDLVDEMTTKPFSLHFLFGPRQVGKTTAVHLMIHKLLKKNDPKSIFYYSCDSLIDHRELGEIIDNYLKARSAWGVGSSIIFLDEVTMVKEWWRALKERIDRGLLTKDVVVVTGSASMELERHKELFPGRRGNGVDYRLLPLSFSEYARFIGNTEIEHGGLADLEKNASANKMQGESLKELFGEYLHTGGFPNTIKDWRSYGTITPETFRTYLDWVRGDWSHAGRSDRYMKEVLSYILRSRGTPISWNGISSETSINSPNTARTYVETLESLFVTLTLSLLKQDGSIDRKKNRKVHFIDPFLYRLFSDYARVEILTDTILEAAVASNIARTAEVYYWKQKKEIDVVCKEGKEYYGFEATVSPGKKLTKPYHFARLYLMNKDSAPLYLTALEKKR
ncbi:MAG: ATP-binding protein [Thermoplasmata archaeon]|nr:ATP-binding protein [Thermoplasmata archaeon]